MTRNPFLTVLRTLSETRYVSIGGFAAVIHGSNRFTPDLNIVIDFEPNESERIIRALLGCELRPGAGLDPAKISDAQVRQEWSDRHGLRSLSLNKGSSSPFSVDLLLTPPLPFEELFSRSQVISVQDVSARICSLPCLIEMKRMANRSQDRIDLENLAWAARLRESGDNLPLEELERGDLDHLEHLLAFSRLSAGERVEWLGDMLRVLSGGAS